MHPMNSVWSWTRLARRVVCSHQLVLVRNLSVGIIGVPNVGKSTLFNALTSSQLAQASNYPFCTIEPNVGSVLVPDPHVETISKFFKPRRKILAEVKLVDIAGLVRGASNNAGLGNKFLEHIRQVDAIIHCVRCFPDVNITHVEGTVDPYRDLEIIDTELILSDLQTCESSIQRLQRKVKAGNKEDKQRLEVLERSMAVLSKDQPVRSIAWHKEDPEIQKMIKDSGLLTAKPMMFVANLDESQLTQLLVDGQKDVNLARVEEYAIKQRGFSLSSSSSSSSSIHSQSIHMDSLVKNGVVGVCAQLEAELIGANEDEKQQLLAAVGLKEPALATVARLSYGLLGLQSYYTAGEQEVRAWTINMAATALQAARVIHTDIERGFIRAEVYSVQDLITHGSEANVRRAGALRTEGKSYVVRDDDIIHFLFNV